MGRGLNGALSAVDAHGNQPHVQHGAALEMPHAFGVHYNPASGCTRFNHSPVIHSHGLGHGGGKVLSRLAVVGTQGLAQPYDDVGPFRNRDDLFGRALQVSISGFADEIAAAASLVMGQGNEAQPVVLMRGLAWSAPANPASELIRPATEDMFR